jgi:hypothetical protein
LAATILLAVGAAVLLAVALTSWGLISAVATLIAGALVIGAVFLARQAALWTSTRLSVLPDASPPRPTRVAVAESMVTSASSNAVQASNPQPEQQPNPQPAIVGPPRPLSPPKPGAPIKRRLGAVVVPVHLDTGERHVDLDSAPREGESSVVENSTPGGGALIVHARSDAEALGDGDRVLVWHLGRHGIHQGSGDRNGGDRNRIDRNRIDRNGFDPSINDRSRTEKPAVTGRFVLLRESDGQAFLGTTRLTDTW